MDRGHIVLVPFPFTDLGGKKVRPALVLYVSEGKDFICAFISSVTRERYGSFEIQLIPSPENGLKSTSFVKLDKLATLQERLAIGSIGMLEGTYMEEVDDRLRLLLGL